MVVGSSSLISDRMQPDHVRSDTPTGGPFRDEGRTSSRLAAVALFDLDGEHSALFISSVAEFVAVLGCDQRLPTGLLVAAR